MRFEWDLAKVPTQPAPLPVKHEIKIQANPDVESLWEGIQRAFLNENAWMVSLESHLDQMRKKTFPDGKPLAGMDVLVLQHGSRVVGVSALQAVEGDGPQLLSGVVLEYEYQRRGLGSALLLASLRHLADRGLEKASVITRGSVPAARYLYPKFGGRIGEVISPAPAGD
ncbi:MAG: GNAT family N-acetyltransferase [Verrucomicrobia bacterium]|nr:GNAT family N-acetyltransferase [Verrucomicrobiota bacterium]